MGNRFSFSGKLASCNMENGKTDSNADKQLVSGICHDEISFYKVDSNYLPSTVKINEVPKDLAQAVILPVNLRLLYLNLLKEINANTGPPYLKNSSDVELAGICVLRI